MFKRKDEMSRDNLIFNAQVSPLPSDLPAPTPNTHTLGQPQGVYLEKGHAGASMNRAVLNGSLISQIIHRLNGHFHALHSQEGSQVGRVR